jgi:hypothetical protein
MKLMNNLAKMLFLDLLHGSAYKGDTEYPQCNALRITNKGELSFHNLGGND